jgi:hypothetical protein
MTAVLVSQKIGGGVKETLAFPEQKEDMSAHEREQHRAENAALQLFGQREWRSPVVSSMHNYHGRLYFSQPRGPVK